MCLMIPNQWGTDGGLCLAHAHDLFLNILHDLLATPWGLNEISPLIIAINRRILLYVVIIIYVVTIDVSYCHLYWPHLICEFFPLNIHINKLSL